MLCQTDHGKRKGVLIIDRLLQYTLQYCMCEGAPIKMNSDMPLSPCVCVSHMFFTAKGEIEKSTITLKEGSY